MDEYSGNVQRASTYSPLPTRERARETIGQVREVSSNGVMDEDSGKVQKASTHELLHTRDTIEIHIRKGQGKVIQRGDGRRFRESSEGTHASSRIVMYLAAVESHIAALDQQPPALPNKEGREMSGQLHPTG